MRGLKLALLLLTFSTLLFSFNHILVPLAVSELTHDDDKFNYGWSSSKAIFIRSNGSVEPSYAPIRVVNNTYILTDDIEFYGTPSFTNLDVADFGGIIVEKDDIVIDGNGHTLKGQEHRSGIFLDGRRSVTIKNMRIQGFAHGIFLSFSSDIKVVGNSFVNNVWGILFWVYTYYNEVTGNEFTGGGLFLRNYCFGNIIWNNTLNGKRLVYLEGESDRMVGGEDIGQVILMRCSRITVKDLKISGTNMGIELFETIDSRIENNTVSGIQGLGVYNCGIYLFSSSNNKITGNSLIGNTLGIYLERSSNNNTIRGNLVANNERGIQLEESSGNSVYRNNFTNNMEQAMAIDSNGNAWDDGSNGNYWSDYSGKDENNDGVGDTPYVINEENKDRYPLVKRKSIEIQPSTEKNLIIILVICGVVAIVVFLIFVMVLRKRQNQ